MLIYKYDNYISEDKERLEERIQYDIAKNVHDLATVESLAEDQYENIEEFNVSIKQMFQFMKDGYVFLEYCSTEAE